MDYRKKELEDLNQLGQMSVIDIIKKWIELELYYTNSYNQLASLVPDPSAQDTFRRISEDTKKHAEYLREAVEALGGKAPQNLTPIAVVYFVTKDHLVFEEAAMETYRQLAGQVDKPKVKEIFQRLVKDETEHHDELSNLIQRLEKNVQL